MKNSVFFENIGFTLVEVIVVAVIVAVLAAVAVPLYIGYINDSNRNSANNSAGSAASFLAAARDAQANVTGSTPLAGGSAWIATLPSTQTVQFIAPEGTSVSVVAGSLAALPGGGTVQAVKGGQTSGNYSW